jgi:5-formyltetrahydrofolate cyclo-ligase
MITAMTDAKAALRSRIRAERAAARQAPVAAAVADGLLSTAHAAGLLAPGGRPGPGRPLIVAAYIASPGEPDVGPIRASVREADGLVLLPIPGSDGQLAWAMDDGHYRADERLPVQVPSAVPLGSGLPTLIARSVDLLLVPALAVDESGTRLGQGGGYYDRLLAERTERATVAGESSTTTRAGGSAPQMLVVAVVHDDELLPARAIPRAAHDQPVAAVLTPTRFVRLRE